MQPKIQTARIVSDVNNMVSLLLFRRIVLSVSAQLRLLDGTNDAVPSAVVSVSQAVTETKEAMLAQETLRKTGSTTKPISSS